jgi:hypothetical protein
MQAKGAATLVSFVQHFSGIADIASVTESMIDFQTEAAVLRRSRDFYRVIRAQYQFVCQREAAHVCRAFRI